MNNNKESKPSFARRIVHNKTYKIVITPECIDMISKIREFNKRYNNILRSTLYLNEST